MRMNQLFQSHRAVLALAATQAVFVGFAHAQVASQWIETDPSGSTVRNAASDTFETGSTLPMSMSQNELWRFSDSSSTFDNVSLSGNSGEVWSCMTLNNERLGFFELHGSGSPVFEYSVVSEDPGIFGAASAEDASMCLMYTIAGDIIKVRSFTASGGATPLWTYEFPPEFSYGNAHNVDVSDDGTIGIAVGVDPDINDSQIVVFETATGNLLNRLTIPARITGVELSRDGSRAVFTEGGGLAEVVSVPALDTLTFLGASGGGGWQRISGDGKSVAAGGFNVLVARETSPGNWTTQVSFSESGNWFGNGMALSDDGSKLFVASHNYSTGYIDLTYRVFDTATGSVTAQTSTSGAAGKQDSVRVAQASADGSVFACASWGTIDNVHPEVQVFDADLNTIGGIDSPGSAFDMSMSRDGRYVAAGTKAVHANTSGRGGAVIVIDLGGSCYADCDQSTGAGVLDIFDFLCFQDSFVAGGAYACDCDTSTGPGVCDIFDFLCFQDAFVAGCP